MNCEIIYESTTETETETYKVVVMIVPNVGIAKYFLGSEIFSEFGTFVSYLGQEKTYRAIQKINKVCCMPDGSTRKKTVWTVESGEPIPSWMIYGR